MEETKQEEQIQEAQVLEDETSEEGKRGKIFRIEIALVVFIGVLLGFLIKSEAARKVTIGFEDYKITSRKPGYDLTKLEQDLKSEMEKQQAQEQSAVQAGQPTENQAQEGTVQDDVTEDKAAVPEQE